MRSPRHRSEGIVDHRRPDQDSVDSLRPGHAGAVPQGSIDRLVRVAGSLRNKSATAVAVSFGIAIVEGSSDPPTDKRRQRPKLIGRSCRVPRFFFHIANGERFLDDEGVVLPDVPAAIAVASVGAREMVAEDLKQGHGLPLNDRIEIYDESGRIVGIVTFRDAVGLEGKPE